MLATRDYEESSRPVQSAHNLLQAPTGGARAGACFCPLGLVLRPFLHDSLLVSEIFRQAFPQVHLRRASLFQAGFFVNTYFI